MLNLLNYHRRKKIDFSGFRELQPKLCLKKPVRLALNPLRVNDESLLKTTSRKLSAESIS